MEPGSSLTSWQSAFEDHPIPATRAILKQLQHNISNEKERLRTLVGNSYRPLLSTAQTITSLYDLSTSAESHIHSLSLRCKPPAPPHNATPPSTSQLTLALLRLTQHCLRATSKALKDTNILVSAQLLVITRLLLKCLSDSNSNLRVLESLRRKAGNLRRGLIELLERLLSTPSTSEDQLVKAIVSYSLITSSSPGDSIKHFQTCRTRVLREHSELSSELLTHKRKLEELKYLIASLRMGKLLYGSGVNDELARLQKEPILMSETFKELEMLELDRLLVFVPEDIRTFMPYVKRYTPSKDEVKENMEEWGGQLRDVFAKGLRSYLEGVTGLEELLELRREMMLLILPEYFNFPGVDKLVEAIRGSVNECIKTLLKKEVETLQTIVSTSANSDMEGKQSQSLWQETHIKRFAEKSAMATLSQIQSRHEGQTRPLRETQRSLQKWSEKIAAHRIQISGLRQQRWQDSLQEAYDEDEEVVTSLAFRLSNDDPQLYEGTLQQSLEVEIARYQENLSKEVDGVEHEVAAVHQVVYLLRLSRVSVKILQTTAPEVKLEEVNTMVAKLHQALAGVVVQRLTKTMRHFAASTTMINRTALLENLPSPKAFQTLRQLCLVMADVGGDDLWSPAATALAKTAVWSAISQGDLQAVFMQNDFDEDYLGVALGQRIHDQQDQEKNDRSVKASEYWSRTRLLFGLL